MENRDNVKHIVTIKDDSIAQPYDPNKLVDLINGTINFVPDKKGNGENTIVGAYCKNNIFTNATIEDYNAFNLHQNVSLDLELIKALKRAHLPIQFVDCHYYTDKFNTEVKPLLATNPQQFEEKLRGFSEMVRLSVKEVMENNVKTAIKNNVEIKDAESLKLKNKLIAKDPTLARTK